jgi:hypothetical protein
MAKKASIYSAVVLIVVAGLFAGGYLLMSHRSETECGFCRRHISPKAHVVAEVGGRRRNVCCAHCAVTEARQEKKPLRLIAVTDYPTGKMVSPDGAWFVEDSRVITCYPHKYLRVFQILGFPLSHYHLPSIPRTQRQKS